MAVNIDPPVKNKGAISVWWQINKAGRGQRKGKHTHWANSFKPVSSLRVWPKGGGVHILGERNCERRRERVP
jgi:hypothetical protein